MDPMNLDLTEVFTLVSDAAFIPRSYSGRGMMGRECLGFSTPDSPMESMAAILDAAIRADDCTPSDSPVDRQHNVKIVQALLTNSKSDSLGRGTIVYFPDVDWSAEVLAEAGLLDENEEDDEF